MGQRSDQDNLNVVMDEAQSGWSRLDSEEIFRQLVRDEIRQGRATRSRRSRILSLAGELGIRPDEAARHFEECRLDALSKKSASPTGQTGRILGVGLIVALLVAAELLVVWFFGASIRRLVR